MPESTTTLVSNTTASLPIPVINQPQAAPQPSGWLEQWGYKAFVQSLKNMPYGQLHLTLPNGQTLILGQNQAGNFAGVLQVEAHLTVRHWGFFKRVLTEGHVGAGEAYVEGLWDSPHVDKVLAWFLVNQQAVPFFEGTEAFKASSTLNQWAFKGLGEAGRWLNRIQHWGRANTVAGSQANIEAHYDLSNDFFKLFLDAETMAYSSALFHWPHQALADAQRAKLERLCQSLKLTATDHLLEIGTGWGGMACYAATTYGCKVTSVTISKAQFEEAQKRVEAEGLTDRVTLLLMDYRQLHQAFPGQQYDKLVSVEMIEAVGDAFYEAFFAQCQRLLKPNGLMALQMITCPDSRYKNLKSHVDYIQKHVFPGSLLPALGRLNQATQKTGALSLISLHDMTLDYAQTLACWDERFLARQPEVLALGFDERFIRHWHYYLRYCRAAFATRNIGAVQALYSAPNNACLMQAL